MLALGCYKIKKIMNLQVLEKKTTKDAILSYGLSTENRFNIIYSYMSSL